MPLDPSQYASLFANQQRMPYTLTGDMEGGTPYGTVPERIAARTSVSYEPQAQDVPEQQPQQTGGSDSGLAYFAALAQLGSAVANVIAAQRKKPKPPGAIIEGTASQGAPIDIQNEDYHRYLPGG